MIHIYQLQETYWQQNVSPRTKSHDIYGPGPRFYSGRTQLPFNSVTDPGGLCPGPISIRHQVPSLQKRFPAGYQVTPIQYNTFQRTDNSFLPTKDATTTQTTLTVQVAKICTNDVSCLTEKNAHWSSRTIYNACKYLLNCSHTRN